MIYDTYEHPERRPKDGKYSEEQFKQCHGENKIIPVS